MLKTPFEVMRELMDGVFDVRYSDLEREQALCIELLDMAQRENYTYGIAFAHTYLGDYYIAQNDSTRCGEELRIAKALCIDNAFNDLLLRVYNLLGICYESLSDEQTALRQYMNALEILEEYPDPMLECIVLNNIAADFEQRNAYREATVYYERIMARLPQCAGINNYSDLQFRFCANLSEVLLFLGETERASDYLNMCAGVDTRLKKEKQCLLGRGWSHYWAVKGDAAQAGVHLQALLAQRPEQLQDKYFAFEILMDACETAISIKHKDYAEQLLSRVLGMCTGNEVDRMQQIQKLKVVYCETFGSQKEQYEVYHDYYRSMLQAEERMNQVRAEGMKASLLLHSALREKDAAVEGMRRMESEVHLDELTGLYNRRHFNRQVSKTVARTDLQRLGFVMLDVDYFKEYNDTYGHSAGDRVLQQVAQLLQAHAGGCVTPARYGGDEFICVCLDKTDQEIEACIFSLREALDALNIAHSTSPCADRVTLSIGYHNVPFRQHMHTDVLLDAADQALYRAKYAGRNDWSK